MSLVFNNTEIPYMTWNGNPTTGIFNGNVVWGKLKPGRYEYCLFDAGDYNSVNSGTLSEPLSSFDSVMFKVLWAGNPRNHGINYYTESISDKYVVPYRFSTDDKFFCNVIMIDCPSSGTTFNTISAAGVSMTYTRSTKWERQRDYNTMAGYTLYPIINAIYGVKYEL